MAEHGRDASKAWNSWITSTTVIATLAIVFAPVGLFLIWRHQSWSKQAKIRWSGLSLVSFAMIFSVIQHQQGVVLKDIAAADKLWTDGKIPDAVDKYRGIIGGQFVPESEKSRLYRRVIEFDCENDNPESAKKLIEKANKNGTILTLTSAKAKQLEADVMATHAKESSSDQAAKIEKNKQEKVPSSDSKKEWNTVQVGGGIFSRGIEIRWSTWVAAKLSSFSMKSAFGAISVSFIQDAGPRGVNLEQFSFRAYDKSNTLIESGRVHVAGQGDQRVNCDITILNGSNVTRIELY